MCFPSFCYLGGFGWFAMHVRYGYFLLLFFFFLFPSSRLMTDTYTLSLQDGGNRKMGGLNGMTITWDARILTIPGTRAVVLPIRRHPPLAMAYYELGIVFMWWNRYPASYGFMSSLRYPQTRCSTGQLQVSHPERPSE
jgi:hypothetical protein